MTDVDSFALTSIIHQRCPLEGFILSNITTGGERDALICYFPKVETIPWIGRRGGVVHVGNINTK
jgi:hypothetical protein